MSKINFEKLWSFINENKTLFEAPPHLLCTLCQNLIINCRRTPCECKYCVKCITKYLENEDKYCCGAALKCRATKLNLSRDIKGDNKTNIDICNIAINCPNKGCYYHSSLTDVFVHYQTCVSRQQTNNSHYSTPIWGCEIAQGFESYYDKLLANQSNEIKEMKLAINNIKSAKKSQLEKLIQENKSHEEEIKKLSTVIIKMDTEITELKSSKRQYNKDMDHLNKSNAELRKSINRITNEIKDMAPKFKSIVDNPMTTVIDPLKQKLEFLDKEIKDLNKNYVKIIKELSRLDKSNAESSEAISDSYIDIAQLTRQVDGLCFNFSVLAFKIDKLEIENGDSKSDVDSDSSICMYTWSVNNFTSYKAEALLRKNRKLTSKDFHASDKSYKIHFDLYPCGYGEGEGTCLSLFAVIKKTNQAAWDGALSYDIAVSIAARGQRHNTKKLGKIEKNARVSSSDIDHSVGIEKLIEIERIFEEPLLLDNNTLTLEFIVKRK